jgi:hypothetical protein
LQHVQLLLRFSKIWEFLILNRIKT